VPAAVFRLLGLCAAHPIYDYRPRLEALGFSSETSDLRVFGVGPALHRVWMGRRLSP
jgi:hypothetical protein